MHKVATMRKVPESTRSYSSISEGVADTKAFGCFKGLKMGGKEDKIWALPKAPQSSRLRNCWYLGAGTFDLPAWAWICSQPRGLGKATTPPCLPTRRKHTPLTKLVWGLPTWHDSVFPKLRSLPHLQPHFYQICSPWLLSFICYFFSFNQFSSLLK